MRNILIILLIISAGMVIPISLHKRPETTEMSVLRDVTDLHLAQPNDDEIIQDFNLTGLNKWNGAIFRFSNVSDISFTPVSEIKIAPEYEWFSNEIERTREIQNFNEGIKMIISKSETDSIGRLHSSIYEPIYRELKRLQESKSNKRILIIYSDLMENNLDESLYSKGKLDTAQINMDSLKVLFEHKQILPNLTGIDIYIIYQPENAEIDREYKIISAFYRKLLESKGAKVTIGANLKI